MLYEVITHDTERALPEDALRELDGLLARLDERTFAGSGERVGKSEVLRVADRLVKGGL